MIDPKALPPTVYSEEEGGLLREFLGFADFVTDNPPMQKREVSVRMIVAAAQALRDLTAENERLQDRANVWKLKAEMAEVKIARLKALGDGLAEALEECNAWNSEDQAQKDAALAAWETRDEG